MLSGSSDGVETYSLVEMDSVFAGDDVGNGRALLLARGLLRLRLWVVFHHFDGLGKVSVFELSPAFDDMESERTSTYVLIDFLIREKRYK